MWVVEIELLSSGVAAGAVVQGAHSPASKQFVSEGYSFRKKKIKENCKRVL